MVVWVTGETREFSVCCWVTKFSPMCQLSRIGKWSSGKGKWKTGKAGDNFGSPTPFWLWIVQSGSPSAVRKHQENAKMTGEKERESGSRGGEGRGHEAREGRKEGIFTVINVVEDSFELLSPLETILLGGIGVRLSSAGHIKKP